MNTFSTENWFVAQLKPQGMRQAKQNLARQGFKHFCPTRRESVLRSGKAVSRDVPLFPGYLFVQFDPNEPGWTSINATRGVSRLLLSTSRPTSPLPSQFMAGLMARCDELGAIVANPNLALGDTIRIVSGPFAETIGKIERVTDNERVQILMELMGQTTRVLVRKSHLEKL